jgi:hypothetical protein
MATEITIPPKPFTYADGTPAVAGQVNSNFDKVFDENFTVAGYTYFGWWRFGNGLEYNAANAFQSVSDVDLTSILQKGDKIRWFHDPTNTQKYGLVSHIDYDDTVANRSYVEVIGDTVLDETVELDGIGVSRIANPDGWPQDPDFGAVIVRDTEDRTLDTGLGAFQSFSQIAIDLPRGDWELTYSTAVRINRSTAAILRVRTTLVLSTSLTTQWDSDFDCHSRFGSVTDAGQRHERTKKVSLSTGITLRVAILGVSSTGSPTSIGFYGASDGASLLRAIPSYK